MAGRVSWFAIFFGDFAPDFLAPAFFAPAFFARYWVYRFTFNGVHYGASKPYQ